MRGARPVQPQRELLHRWVVRHDPRPNHGRDDGKEHYRCTDSRHLNCARVRGAIAPTVGRNAYSEEKKASYGAGSPSLPADPIDMSARPDRIMYQKRITPGMAMNVVSR